MTATIAVVGLGQIGGGMAASAARGGLEARGFDVDPVACERARARGVRTAGSLAEVVDGADLVATSLASAAAIEQTYLGERGLAAIGRPGLVTIECSTVPPELERAITAAQTAAGMRHVEASVIGLEADALAGELFVLTSGERAALDGARVFLDAVTRGHVHVGGPGAAALAKVLNNNIGAVTQVAIAEAMAVCRAEGLDTHAFIDAVLEGRGAGFSKVFERHAAKYADLDPATPGTSTITLKDARSLAALLGDRAPRYHAFAAMLETLEAALADAPGNAQVAIGALAERRARGESGD